MEKTVSVSRLSAKCRGCPRVDQCDHKRMEAMACTLPDDLDRMNVAACSASPLVAELTEPAAAKHDYRHVKIAEGMTVTIDLEDLKKKLNDNFYRSVGRLGYGKGHDS